MISVVIPTYNRSKELPVAVHSVLAQTFTDWELVVVDDGSTDDTADVMRGYAEADGRVKYFRKSNEGVSKARNYGVEHATGEWVVFLDSDDFAREEWLALFHTQLVVSKGVKVCFVGYENDILYRYPSSFDTLIFKDTCVLFLAGTFLVERSLFLRIGGYDSGMAYSENWDLGLRIMLHTDVANRSFERVVGMYYKRNQAFDDREVLSKKVIAVDLLLEKHARVLPARLKARLLSNKATNLNRIGRYMAASVAFGRSFTYDGSLNSLMNAVLSFARVPKKYKRMDRDADYHRARNTDFIVLKDNVK